MSSPLTQNLEVGVAVLSVQLTEVIKDVSDLRGELREHRQEHEREARSRGAARRRLWGAVVVLIGSIDGPLLAFMLTRASR